MKLYSAFNRPKTEKQHFDSFIHKWSYIDENGRLKEDSIDQKELIQSVDFLTTVEIVKVGAYGEDNGSTNYGDFTTIPNDLSSLITTINNYQTSLAEYQASIKKDQGQGHNGTTGENTAKSAEAPNSSGENSH